MFIDFDTFCTIIGRRMRQKVSDILPEIFKYFDATNSGYIGPLELKYAFKKIGENISEEDAAKLIEAIDLNADKKFNYDEFKLLLEELGYLDKDLI